MGTSQVRTILWLLLWGVAGILLGQRRVIDYAVALCLVIALIPLILLKMRATWLLHREYVKVWKRELRRKPLGRLKAKNGRALSRQEAFARLNVARGKSTGNNADLPPSAKALFIWQATALAVLLALLYLLVQWNKP